jgi:hypothetical protein
LSQYFRKPGCRHPLESPARDLTVAARETKERMSVTKIELLLASKLPARAAN